MRQRVIALLLALAVLASVCAVSALAEERAAPAESAETAEPVPEGESAAGDGEAAGEEEAAEEPVPTPAGPDLAENVTIQPDPLGEVSFANVERRMRENNLQLLALEQSVLSIEDIDYDKLYDKLWHQLNDLAQAQWGLVQASSAMRSLSQIPGSGVTYSDYEYHSTYDQLDRAYDAVREQFDAIVDGDMQKDNADVVRQLNNLQDQIVMAGESLYAALTSMEGQEAALRRQLEGLDRTVEEMELRYQLGQISAMQLAEVKSGRTALESGLATLGMNVKNYKLQLEMLIGAEQTGEIALGPLPEVTAEQLAEMDLERDLAAAKERSYELYDAEKTLEDARDQYKEDADNWAYSEKQMEYRNAKRTWQAAQYTYNNTVQNYELKFRTLYAQVGDYHQIWEAAKVSLACEQSSYAASELKFQQGTISRNALLTAGDDLREAEEKVRSAAGDLFSTYNTYCWAVQHGILN
nr:TolC family protein [uncultured Oscillibacter sp.]